MMFNGRDGNQGIFYKEIFAGAPAAADLAGQQRCSRYLSTQGRGKSAPPRDESLWIQQGLKERKFTLHAIATDQPE